ncbi:MAG: porin [Pseudomonadota bacterium]
MQRLIQMVMLFCLMGGPALAQDDAVQDLPPSFAASAPDWTGRYAGIQLGYGDVSNGDSGSVGGVHLGYNHDFGTFVLGGELDYDIANIDIGPGTTIDSIKRFKLRAGYDFGRALGYVTAGVAEADGTSGDDSGPVYGIGFAYELDSGVTFGAEVLRQEFDGLAGPATETDTTTITVRGGIRF